jgi:hypothetical protein
MTYCSAIKKTWQWLFWRQAIPALIPWGVLCLASFTFAPKSGLNPLDIFIGLVKNGFYAFVGLHCLMDSFFVAVEEKVQLYKIEVLFCAFFALDIVFMFCATNPVIHAGNDTFSYTSSHAILVVVFSFACASQLRFRIYNK